MGNIFIFQIRRIGDFFQSIPLIEYLYNNLNRKKEYRIDILIDEAIKDIAKMFNPGINLLTYRSFTQALSENSHIPLSFINGISASEFFIFLNKTGPFLNMFSDTYALAVNLNFDIANSLFMSFFKNCKRGVIAYKKSVKDSRSMVRGGASNYFFNSVRNRKFNRVNIVDIFSLIGAGGVAEIKGSYDILKLKPVGKAKQSVDNEKKQRICISIGATSERRVWPFENYAALINLLDANFNCEFTLVGTKEEADGAMEVRKHLPQDINIIDLTGKTSVDELVYFMKDFDLVISSDTGTLHIAQIFNVPSVSIFTGNANFYETGPHVKKSAVIHSKIDCYPCFEHEPCRYNYACRNDIKPEDVFNLALTQIKINKYDSREINRAAYMKTVIGSLKDGIKKGNFSIAFCEHPGAIHFYPLLKNKVEKRALASEILKFCWISVLSEAGEEINHDKVLRYTKKYYTIKKDVAASLTSELLFIKSVFENGRNSFGIHEDSDGEYFKRFKETVTAIGKNYDYFKLACDYFMDEINSSGILKAFNDINLLIGNAVKILDNL